MKFTLHPTFWIALVSLKFAGIAHAAYVSFHITPPIGSSHDISNLTGAGAAGLESNVSSGDPNATYIASDRPIQGQTFMTGGNAGGYHLGAVTLRHVTYGTYTSIPNLQYTIRVVRPSGSTLTVLASQTVSVPAATPGNFPSNDGGAGSGRFIQFLFDPPIRLDPATTYGFDVGGGTVGHYWETDGTSLSPKNGTAYSSGANGVGDNTFTARTGDRVFVVSLWPSSSPAVTPPTISPSNLVYAGTPVTLSARVSGPAPLYYQWQWDTGLGAQNITYDVPGANSTNLVVDTTGLSGEYFYHLVVTNSGGAVTSAPIALTVNAASAPIVTSDTTPTSPTRFTGQGVVFRAAFDGSPPISYQWFKSGEPIAGATNTSLILTNLQLSDADSYSLLASNAIGTTSSSAAQLTMLTAPPPPAPGTYAYAVRTNNLIAYWRLNDPADAQLLYDSGDSLNARNSLVTLGVPGMQAPAFPGFPSDNTAASFNGGASVAQTGESIMNGLTNFTVLAWMKPTGANGGITGLLGQNDALECIYSDANGLTVWIQLDGNWFNPNTGTNGFARDKWTLVAIVADGSHVYTYVDGGEARTVSNGSPTGSSTFPFNIGGPEIIGYPGENAFNGLLQDVAIFNRALSRAEIDVLYNLATGDSGAPSILFQPSSVSLYPGRTARFTASGIRGTAPLSYQWRFEGAPLADGGNISGATTSSLTISNISTANAGRYQLFVSNNAGQIGSSVATLSIVQPTGAPYESAVIAQRPIAYWRLNETGDPSSGTLLAHDYFGGFDGTYGASALNGYQSVPGPLPDDGFAGFESTNTALRTATDDSWVTVPGLGVNSDSVTFTMWIKPNGPQSEYTGLFMTRSGTEGGVSYGGTYQVNNANQLIYAWNNNSDTTWNFRSGLTIPENQWSFVAVAIDPTKAVLHLFYKDGSASDVLLSATNAIPHISEGWNGPARIGGDPNDTARTFKGEIDEVAVFNYALTPAQVLDLYNGVTPPPGVPLTMQRSGANITLGWTQGVLQEATSLTGSWSPVNGAAAPSHTVTPSGAQKFYRVRVSP